MTQHVVNPQKPGWPSAGGASNLKALETGFFTLLCSFVLAWKLKTAFIFFVTINCVHLAFHIAGKLERGMTNSAALGMLCGVCPGEAAVAGSAEVQPHDHAQVSRGFVFHLANSPGTPWRWSPNRGRLQPQGFRRNTKHAAGKVGGNWTDTAAFGGPGLRGEICEPQLFPKHRGN